MVDCSCDSSLRAMVGPDDSRASLRTQQLLQLLLSRIVRTSARDDVRSPWPLVHLRGSIARCRALLCHS